MPTNDALDPSAAHRREAYWQEMLATFPTHGPGGMPFPEVQAHMAALLDEFQRVLTAYHARYPQLDYPIYRVAIEELRRRLSSITFPWFLADRDATARKEP